MAHKVLIRGRALYYLSTVYMPHEFPLDVKAASTVHLCSEKLALQNSGPYTPHYCSVGSESMLKNLGFL